MRVASFFAPLTTAKASGLDVNRNLFREDTGDPERPYRHVRRPGLAAMLTGLHGPVRGGVELDGAAYCVAGERFYSIASDWTATELGTVAPDTKPAMMVTNGSAGNQVAFTAGGNLYAYNTQTGVFAQVTDPDLVGYVLGIVATDLYGVVWFRDSRAFQITDIADLTDFPTGDTAERSNYVDNIVSIVADQKELLFLGSQTNETYEDTGNSSFPFEPVPYALSRQGSAATHGAVLVGDAPYWVNKSPDGAGAVLRVRGGYIPQRVSTHAIEKRIQALTLISDAYAYTFEEMGHRFYVLTFPSADVTLAFDEAVAPEVAWSEWPHRDTISGNFDAHLGRCHFYAFGKHLVGSRKDGTIFEQSLAYADDAGDPIVWDRIFRGPLNNGKRVFLTEARLDAEMGVGLTVGQGVAPIVELRKSKDGGKTFGPAMERSLGAKGDYGHKARWQGLGYADDPAWWLRGSDPVVTGLNDFHVEAGGGTH